MLFCCKYNPLCNLFRTIYCSMTVHSLVAVLFFLLFISGRHTVHGAVDFQFVTGAQYTQVNEEQPIGTVIIDLQVSYIYNSFLRNENTGQYSFNNGHPYFTLNPDTGQISNAVILDRESLNTTQFSLLVNFTSSLDPSLTGTQSIQISIIDINDNPPTFNQSVYSVSILEGISIGSQFYQVNATDPDIVQRQLIINEEEEDFGGYVYTISNGRVIYSIIGGNHGNHFSINPDNGTLSVVREGLDIDETNLYILTLLAVDGGSLNNTSQLIINILDSNDNSPIIFHPNSFNLTFIENVQPGIIIVDYINATDSDYGINSIIDFSIHSGDITNSFNINSTNGQLVMSSSLDREAGNPLILTIAATDRGIPPQSDTITVTITLLDINDSPPNFTQPIYQFNVQEENTLIGSVIGTVIAIDGDNGENGTVVYNMTTNTSVFTLNNITGELIINQRLDRETVSYYELTIEAHDTPLNSSLALTSTVTVQITVTDINDHRPVWDYSNVSVGILDTQPIGYQLITLHASDEDIGLNGLINYEFLEPFDDDFIIDTSTGNVSVNHDLDFDTKSFYSYTVRAYDSGSPIMDSLLTHFNITVHTPNIRSPRFPIKEHNVTLLETLSLGTVILNVTARDGDPGLIGELFYRIPYEWKFGGAGSFDVDLNTGSVFINGTLDFDYSNDDNSIFFQVEAFDGGFPTPLTARTNVTVFLINANDEPPLIKTPPTPTIPENMPPETQFADLSTLTSDRDPGPGGLFNFTLLGVHGTNETLFNLSSDGILTSLETFDREERPQGFILSILTTDYGIPTQSYINNVPVAIGDQNDQSPFFEESPDVTAYELITPGQVILENFTGIDYDIGSNALLRYAISGGDDLNQFSIDTYTGTLSVAKVLNRTEQDEYNLTIYVTDSGNPPLYGYGYVQVTVIDSNDNAPIFQEPLIVSFSEDSPLGTIITTLNVTDADEGTNSLISYYLSPYTITNNTLYDNITNTSLVRFELNSTNGQLTIHDTFDREIEDTFELTVIAIDSGLVPIMLTSTALLVVNLEDANDNIPVFLNDSYNFSVIENAPLGTMLGHVTATDIDATPPNNLINYSLIGERSEELAVDAYTGLVYVNGTVDWELGPLINISVIATDNGHPPLSSIVPLTVYIEDINDRAPIWDEATLNISVQENLPPYSSVGYILAVDPDSPGNNSLVRYSIDIDYSTEHFELNTSTGHITTLKTFNREERDMYDLQIIATDHGTPLRSSTATVYIEILDSNDFNPQFTTGLYTGSVNENASPNSFILQVQATDNDSGSNSELIYSLVDFTIFTIDPSTGIITTSGIELDYESIPMYNFAVLVSDKGVPPRTNTSTVFITVIDYNDNAPIFTQDIYTVDLVENRELGSTVVQVIAFDADQGDNAIIEYSLLTGDEYFGIDNQTGVVYTHNFINREVIGSSISLTVLANNSQSSDTYQSTISYVNITIADLNDQAPRFNSTITIPLSEDTPIGTVVYVLRPVDGDQGPNGSISYTLIDGHINTFDVNDTTGQVTLLEELNYDSQQHYYYLSIKASDNGLNPLTNYTTLILQVTDTNNHPPTFTSPLYTLSIDYAITVGREVFTIRAIDKDTGPLTYSILLDNEYSSLFIISPSTGTITVGSSLISYSDQTFNLTLQVSDQIRNATCTLTIHVTPSGTSPTFNSTFYVVNIAENHSGSVYELFNKVIPPDSNNIFDITHGNDNDTFSLSGSALVVDGSKLNYELLPIYQLTLQVAKSGVTSYAIITVQLDDINNFPPLFSTSYYFVPLYEDTIIGQSFYQILAFDKDPTSPHNTIHYDLISGNSDNIFRIDTLTGQLSLNKRLDYDTDSHYYSLNVTATNSLSSPQLSSWAVINITLFNGNRHPPVFDRNVYIAPIQDENTPNGSYIGVTVLATDNDANSSVRYGLLGNHRHYDIDIDPVKGNLTVGEGGFDYERISGYTLTVIATDDGTPQLTSTAIIVVPLRDLNDNIPIWDKGLYETIISENITLGTVIGTVRATDRDPVVFTEMDGTIVYENTNGLVRYSITGGDPLSQFTVGSLTGDITISSPLNREVYNNYTLILNATDGGGRYSNSIFVITVLDINDVRPHFSSPILTATVPEDAPLGTYITQLIAQDEDTTNGNYITYTIIEGNEDTFIINSTTGQLYLNSSLDREFISSYNLTIQANDNGVTPLTGHTNLLIQVLDINEHAPIFTNSYYEHSLNEDAPIGTTLINIKATDLDYSENSTIIYTIQNDFHTFSIDHITGELSLSGELDYESIEDYNLTVIASDSGHLSIRQSSRVQVYVTIIDINDNNPVFDYDIYTVNISEGAEPFTDLIQVQASDSDSTSNSQLIYSLNYNGQNIAENSFTINETSGQISLTSTPLTDYEDIQIFNLTLNVTDSGSPPLSTTSQLIINILDINDNTPMFTEDYYEGIVTENSNNSNILTVMATDHDSTSNGLINYYISQLLVNISQCKEYCQESLCSIYNTTISEESSEELFNMSTSDGILSLIEPLDREENDQYGIIITAIDSGVPSLSSSACVFINVTDTNDNSPIFTNTLYTANISENLPHGSLVTSVHANDDDIGVNSDIVYSIINGSEYFTVHPTNGQIRTLVSFDREATDEYTILVSASDLGTPSNQGTANVLVYITDINDTPPLFDEVHYNVSIPENISTDTSFLTVSATDEDLNSQLTYSIVSYTAEFGINSTTGVIYTLGHLNREDASNYQLTLLVSDNGGLNSTAQLSITITDINDNAPIFQYTNYTSELTEGTVYIDYHILTLLATDNDTGVDADIYYSIYNITPHDYMDQFIINTTSGALTCNGGFDAEDTQSITITVQADNGPSLPIQYTLTTVTITIIDINDHIPSFPYPSYTTGLLESSPIGTHVLTLHATDQDSTLNNSIITYTLKNDTTEGHFNINSTTGAIYTISDLDRETLPSYELTVIATDNGYPPLSSTTTVTLIILDSNDNRPIFQQDEYYFNIYENQPMNTFIGVVLATDVDLNNISYEISHQEEGTPFHINITSGELYSSTPLDREDIDTYTFTVLAIDDIITRTNSQVNVTITVLDLNDNIPLFEQDFYAISWPEDTLLYTQLLIVNASDDDIDDNEEVSFTILPSKDSEIFTINTTTGELLLFGALNREIQDTYNITLAVTDHGSPPLSSMVPLTFTVLDVNDNIPYLNQSLYTAVISEDTPINTSILTVSGNDYDINNNGQLSYSIISTDFIINPKTGLLSVSKELDYERQRNYLFPVTITDHGIPPLSSTSNISISLIDINDNEPYFEQELYQLSVEENSVLYTPVFTLPGRDRDDGSNAVLRYTILEGNIGFHFTLDEWSGLLATTSQYLDAELNDNFVLTVRAVDQGTPQYTATTVLNITIIDINDNPPIFPHHTLTVSIPENVPTGYTVTTLEATDGDHTHSQLTYSLVNNEDIFAINPITGQVFVNDSIDVETQPLYSLTVLVTDNGQPYPLTDTMTLHILIEDINEYPPQYYMDRYIFNISVNTAIGSQLGTLTAYDDDYTIQTLTYTLQSSINNTIAITPNSGILYINTSPLSIGTHHTDISVTDGLYTTTIPVYLTIHPSDYNGPLFTSTSYSFIIMEGSSLNTTIGSVNNNNNLTSIYFLNSNGDLSRTILDLFEVNSADGRIILIGQLDYETTPIYVLNLVAVSPSGQRGYVLVTITVTDSNDNLPLFGTSNYDIILSEHTPVGTEILSLLTYDSDTLNDNNSYTVLSMNDQWSSYFNLYTNTLSLAGNIDREVTDNITLQVIASNLNTSLSSVANINIHIVDVNDNPPVFEQLYYTVNIPTNTVVGTEIIQITANDLDQGLNGELVYYITHQSVPGSFIIDYHNGSVFVSKSLMDASYEGTTVRVIVLASDRGSPTPLTTSTYLFVTLYKYNTGPPLFSSREYIISINETLQVGSGILHITANDSNTVEYSIINDYNLPFDISPTSGLVTLSSSLNYDLQSFYSFIVVATDDGVPQLSTSTLVNVTIIDINNHSPAFSSNIYHVSISENSPINTPLLQVIATDIDSAETTYQITVNYYINDESLFAVNATTGLIYTTGLIDRETSPHIELLVSAIDSGYRSRRSTSVPVVILVTDVSDEKPVFELNEYFIDLIRLLPSQTLIANITAHDPDIITQPLTYNISYQTIPGLFVINSTTGQLFTSGILMEDMINTSSIVVSAYDGDQMSYVTVNINMIDEGTFCEGAYCTNVTARLLNCNYAIPGTPVCDPYCPAGMILTPKTWLCTSQYCLNSHLVPCLPTEQCLPVNQSCNNTCPLGQSICPTTSTCHPLLEESITCDTNTCINGQTLVRYSNRTQHCSLSSTLPLKGQNCTHTGQVYCIQLESCSNISDPYVCQFCPDHLSPCPHTNQCVTNTTQCCTSNDYYYCELLEGCILTNNLCKLPNIVPTVTSSLILIDTINDDLSKGHMIGRILGNGTSIGSDVQSEELSIIITHLNNNGSSQWEYKLCHNESFDICQSCSFTSPWIPLTTANNISIDNELFLPNTACLRYNRHGNTNLEGVVWLSVKLWDGNTDGYISNSTSIVRYKEPFYTNTINSTLYSVNNTLLALVLLPISEAPQFELSQNDLIITEDISLVDNVGFNINDVITSLSVDYLNEAITDYIPGLSNEELLPFNVRQNYKNSVITANLLRNERSTALNSGQLAGIGIALTGQFTDNYWQISLHSDPQLYVYISDILSSIDQVLLVNTSVSLRLLPPSNYNGNPSLKLYGWDGVLPLSLSPVQVVHTPVYVTNTLQDILHLSAVHQLITIQVQPVPDAPLITHSSLLLPRSIPYTLSYTHEHMFTVLIDSPVSSLRPDKERLEDILYLLLEFPVTINRFYPASSNSTYLSFTSILLNLTYISERIASEGNILKEILPITNISQESHYGPGSSCYDHTTSSGGPTVYSVNELTPLIGTDHDGESLGLAVVSVENMDGVWQYMRNEQKDVWINFPPNITELTSLLLQPADSIRYLPQPHYYWTSNHAPKITIKLWDRSRGNPYSSTLININTHRYINTTLSIANNIGVFSRSNSTLIATRYGCNDVINSGLIHDTCCVCGGDGATCEGCDAVMGSNKKYDSCDVCGGGMRECFGCDGIPWSTSRGGTCNVCTSSSSLLHSVKDCNGDCYGVAVIDECGTCSGGNTGRNYNSEMDCNGVCHGNASLDSCGYCTNTNSTSLDCTGICDGPFRADDCGVCQLPDTRTGLILHYRDCKGVCWGKAATDDCGVCYGGNTGLMVNSTMDACGICNGNSSTCYGCDGILNSGKVIDTCNICGGNDCACFHLTSLAPTRGPRTGSTHITINGAGFFKNTTNYNTSLPYCGGDVTDNDNRAIPVTCQFESTSGEILIGQAHIVHQSTIICITPQLNLLSRLDFNVRIKIDEGPFSNPIPYNYEDYSSIIINSMYPSRGPLYTPTKIHFKGANIHNTSTISCLLSTSTCQALTNNIIPAVYINSTDVYCILPSHSSSCIATIRLTLDGQASGTVHTANFIYAYSHPVVTSLHFTNNLTSIYISFDRSTTLTSDQGITCDILFTPATLSLLGNDSTCHWTSTHQSAILVSLSSNANIHVGSPVIFNNGLLATRGQNYSFEVPNTILYISTSINAVAPTAVLIGPDSICERGGDSTVSYSASNSYYQGYTYFKYKWSLYTTNASIGGVYELVNYLKTITQGTIELPIALFQPSVQYILQLSITNSIGLSTVVNKIITKKDTSSLQVSIISPPLLVISHDKELFIEGRVTSDGCTTGLPYTYQWILYQIINPHEPTLQAIPLSTNTNTSLIYIPSNTFNTTYSYQLHLTVTSDTVQANDSINIIPRRSDCSTNIHGGSHRNVSSNDTLYVKGSLLGGYVWSCSVHTTGEPCYNSTKTYSVINLPPNEPISIPAGHLETGLVYNFTLIDTQKICSSSTVIIEIVPPLYSIATVQIIPPLHYKVPVSEPTVLQGLVYLHTSHVTVTWSCVHVIGQGYVQLNSTNTLSHVSYSDTVTIATTSLVSYEQNRLLLQGRTNRVNLILAPNVLTPGLRYTFQLTAITNGGESTSVELTVQAGNPPVLQNITTTQNGLELSTPYSVSVNWVADSIRDYPLYYQYGLLYEGNSIYWLTGLTLANSKDFTLPSNINGLYITVYDTSVLREHSHVYKTVMVSPMSNINYQTLLNNLKLSLSNNKDWSSTLSSLIPLLVSVDTQLPTSQSSTAMTLFTDILYNYTSPTLLSSQGYSSLIFTTIQLLSNKLSLGGQESNQLLTSINNILDRLLQNVNMNFVTIITPTPHLLTTDTNSLLYTGVGNRDVSAIINSINNLVTHNADIAAQIRFILSKLSSIYCQQSHYGSPSLNITSTSHIKYSVSKLMPYGVFNIHDAIIDLRNILEQYLATQCVHDTSTCIDTCLQIVSISADYFSSIQTNVDITSESRDLVDATLEGIDTERIQLYSNIINMNILTTSNGNSPTLSSPLSVYHKTKTTANEEGTQTVCMYRSTTSTEWTLTALTTAMVSVNGSLYHKCDYTAIGDYAIGLLPVPVIIIPSSTPLIEMTLSSSSVLVSSSYVLMTSEMVSPSPSIITLPQADNTAAIVSAVVLVILLVIVGVVILVIVGAIVFRKKFRSKVKVGIATAEETKVEPLEEKPKTPSIKEEEKKEKKEEEKGVTLGVIELLEGGERFLLGSISVLHTMRLRELRSLLLETFSSYLKNKLFYLCTKELCDIDPATEQQQFVNIVYSNIVYIREVKSDDELTRKQFCICGTVAQFECSNCGMRGYCSQECQAKDWSKSHRKDCERMTEKRQRTDILMRRQLTSGGPLSPVKEEEEEEEIEGGSPLKRSNDWRGFLSQSKLYQSPQQSSVMKPSLPPITGGGTANIDQYTSLRQDIDTNVPISRGASRVTLPHLGGQISVGRLASSNTTLPRQLTITKPITPLPATSTPLPVTSPLNRSIPLTPSLTQPNLTQAPPFRATPLRPSVTSGTLQQQILSPLPMRNERLQYAPNNQLNQSVSERQLFSPIFQPTTPTVTTVGIPPQPTLKRDISISSVGSVDLASSLFPSNKLNAYHPHSPTTLRGEEEESETSSESESEEEGKGERSEVSRPPSLSIRRRHSSKMSSRGVEQEDEQLLVKSEK